MAPYQGVFLFFPKGFLRVFPRPGDAVDFYDKCGLVKPFEMVLIKGFVNKFAVTSIGRPFLASYLNIVYTLE